MPGFIDMHAHTGGSTKTPQPEYVYKLWMAHGVTTSRGVGHGPMMWALGEKARAARNEIVAPRMYTYARPGEAWEEGSIDSPEKAREWVRWALDQDVDGQRIDGLKLGSLDPPIMEAIIDEAHQHGLGTVAHLGQMGLARMTGLGRGRGRPGHDHPLLRTLRVFAQGLQHPELAARLQLQ